MLLGVDDLFVAQGGQRRRIPVHHAHAAVDQSTLVELHESVNDPFVITFIHREPRAVPIATRTEFLQLLEDDAPVLVGPLPRMLQERLPGQVRLLDALVAQPANDLGLGGD